ncbi:MAG: DHA2 family efflux MFS transporter permease subunit [Solirubrobacteraceae bacterium]|nr:DHA2 family efflux MFS transporter permease subunit [Solirubrobacteraceae bacterium]
MSAPPSSILRDRALMTIAAVVVVGAIMSILDTTIINVALRDLSGELDTPLSTVQWVATGYMLALAAVIPLTGWASERFGGRRVWLAAVALFTVTSAACGAAQNVEQLIVMRLLQGVGGGMIMPIGQIMLVQQAGPQRMGRVMGFVAIPMLLAPIFGPTLGGLIVDHLSWRWIFFVNVPFGIAGLVLAMRVLPRTESRPGTPLDWPGTVLASVGAAALVFGLTETGERGGFDGAITWGPTAGGLVLVTLFVLHSLRSPHPLIDVRLFARPGFGSAGATTFVLGGAMFGSMILLPLYFQLARGESATDAGLMLMSQGLGMAIAMPLSGVITDRIGGGVPTIIGVVGLVVTTLGLATVSDDTSYVWLNAVLLARGFAIGMSMMPSMAAAYATLAHAEIPRATTSLTVLQRVGGAIGTALFTVVLTRAMAGRGVEAGGGEGAMTTLPEALHAPAADAFAHTFLVSTLATAVALVPAVILTVVERRARRRTPPAEADGPPTDDGAPVAAVGGAS